MHTSLDGHLAVGGPRKRHGLLGRAARLHQAGPGWDCGRKSRIVRACEAAEHLQVCTSVVTEAGRFAHGVEGESHALRVCACSACTQVCKQRHMRMNASTRLFRRERSAKGGVSGRHLSSSRGKRGVGAGEAGEGRRDRGGRLEGHPVVAQNDLCPLAWPGIRHNLPPQCCQVSYAGAQSMLRRKTWSHTLGWAKHAARTARSE